MRAPLRASEEHGGPADSALRALRVLRASEGGMIGMLTGRFAGDADGGCILDVNGVGYLLACSARTLDRLRAAEGAVRVLVETQVRQDAIVLNGFADAAEREAFRALVEVK